MEKRLRFRGHAKTLRRCECRRDRERRAVIWRVSLSLSLGVVISKTPVVCFHTCQVDGKSASTYEALRDWFHEASAAPLCEKERVNVSQSLRDLWRRSLTTPNVHVLETGRTNISWGGFNIANNSAPSTLKTLLLQGMHFSCGLVDFGFLASQVRATLTGLEYVVDHLDGQYDWISTISGYTYPLASNGAHILDKAPRFRILVGC